jgi:ABC-type bacteriocin/lantibiotic exporter with double-glycine peptidase domain
MMATATASSTGNAAVPQQAGHLPSPFARLRQLLWEDKRDLIILLIYSSVSGVLSLLLPVASQALINIIASGVLLQPLIVLTLTVLLGLLFAGLIRIVEHTLMEVLQQRLFVRIALHLGSHLPRIDLSQLVQSYPPELVNRFFDTMTIQKTLAKMCRLWFPWCFWRFTAPTSSRWMYLFFWLLRCLRCWGETGYVPVWWNRNINTIWRIYWKM